MLTYFPNSLLSPPDSVPNLL